MKNFRLVSVATFQDIYFDNGRVFTSTEDAVEALAEHHRYDDTHPYLYGNIWDLLNEEFETPEERLKWLLSFGKWVKEDVLPETETDNENVEWACAHCGGHLLSVTDEKDSFGDSFSEDHVCDDCGKTTRAHFTVKLEEMEKID